MGTYNDKKIAFVGQNSCCVCVVCELGRMKRETYGPLVLPILTKSSMSKGSLQSSVLFLMYSTGNVIHLQHLVNRQKIFFLIKIKTTTKYLRWTREDGEIAQKYPASITKKSITSALGNLHASSYRLWNLQQHTLYQSKGLRIPGPMWACMDLSLLFIFVYRANFKNVSSKKECYCSYQRQGCDDGTSVSCRGSGKHCSVLFPGVCSLRHGCTSAHESQALPFSACEMLHIKNQPSKINGL